MPTRLLLCTDLDRTVLPNGWQPESPPARPLFRALAARPEVTLVYVSGRHLQLLKEAVADYHIPVPDFAVGDVGSTIYTAREGQWSPWEAWSAAIAPDWRGREHDALAALFRDLPALRLQEAARQNTFKLSYYTPLEVDRDALLRTMRERLTAENIRAALIWSVDEQAHCGLLDVLPARATKVHAVRFLMAELGFGEEHTVFAGDSGNDLPALTSGLQAVLVRNAAPEVVREARLVMQEKGLMSRLYVAQGGFLGMNGHYAAGVLEGVAHYVPQAAEWLVGALDD
ncbi:MAG TPA: HAD-IIB family hydrolase [Gammaproteobacteria bacterium]|nr:HAD-IIB family hydrolase [Gammaproteobacteria bacterium]